MDGMHRQPNERTTLLAQQPPQAARSDALLVQVDAVSNQKLWLILSSTWIGSFLGALDTVRLQSRAPLEI